MSKISGIETHCAFDKSVDVVDLIPHPRNPNKHGDKQIALLAKIIRGQGWRNPIVVSGRSGFIISGHGRLEAAKMLNVEQVPVDVQSFESEAEEYAHLIADNRIAELAETDQSELADLIRELDGEIDLDLTGFDEPSLAELMGESGPDGDEVDAEPQLDKAAELRKKWNTALGQVWELGDHRLLCGDCTVRDEVVALMAGDKAELVFTDPPYGVNLNGSKSKKDVIAGDLTQTAIPFSFEIAVEHATTDKARFYFCGCESNVALYFKLFERFLIQMPKLLIWVKNGFVMRQNGYHGQYELIFYGYKIGGGATWFSGRKEEEASDVWKVSRDPSASYMHPTQKPTELPGRAIRNSCKPGGIVYEPFSGSGSTLMACENLGRKCRAIEIDPGYVAVALERWSEATGKTPKLTDGA